MGIRKRWEDRTPSQKAEVFIFQHDWEEVRKSREFCEKHHSESISNALTSLKIDSFLNDEEGGENFKTLCLNKYSQLCCKYQILCRTDTSKYNGKDEIEEERTLEPNPSNVSASGMMKYYTGQEKLKESLTPTQKMKAKQKYKRCLTQLF